MPLKHESQVQALAGLPLRRIKNGADPYVMIVAPPDFPGWRHKGRYCYEHHLVYWRVHGVVPKAGEVVHHENGDKTDNRSENLSLKTRAEHSREHAKPAETQVITCAACGESRYVLARKWRYKVACGQRDFYCGRTCMARHYGRGRPKRVRGAVGSANR